MGWLKRHTDMRTRALSCVRVQSPQCTVHSAQCTVHATLPPATVSACCQGTKGTHYMPFWARAKLSARIVANAVNERLLLVAELMRSAEAALQASVVHVEHSKPLTVPLTRAAAALTCVLRFVQSSPVPTQFPIA